MERPSEIGKVGECGGNEKRFGGPHRLAVGLVALSVVGIAAYWAGMWSSHRWPGHDSTSWLPETVLHAAGATQNDAFAIASGPVDEDVEGFFVLDFLTGELQCAVISRVNGKFSSLFHRNVVQDLGIDPAKRPTYLMTTGQINFPRGAAAARPGNSIVYVLDTTSGNYAAYGIPWRREFSSTGRAQAAPMTLLDVGRARSATIRE